MNNKLTGPLLVLAISTAATPALAKENAEIPLAKCEKSLGSIAVVDGDTQGWTKYGLASPHGLIAAMASSSGCFAIATAGAPADFLINAIAGDKEQVNQGINMAKGAITEGLVRSGAVSQLASAVPVPMLGGALKMFGGFGGKKKTYAAGLRVISPATGQTIVTGEGEASSSSVTFSGLGDAAATGGYGTSKDGKMLSTAFVQAFNSVVAQGSALASARRSQGPASAAATSSAVAAVNAYTTAVATRMFGDSSGKGATVRTLRAATTLNPTGKRDGLYVEVKDSAGTTGWVSVEDLK